VYINKYIRQNESVGKWGMTFLCEKFGVDKLVINRSGQDRHGALQDAVTLKSLVRKMIIDSEEMELTTKDVYQSLLRIYNLV
jgi:DNA polymerase III epsilon subunit-like protein